jgi:HTH-type transcriptional regulator/antitoxin HigA
MKYTKIATIEQYNQYCETHERLTASGYEKNIDEIELIEILIDEYESRTIDFSHDENPVEILQYLLDENTLSKSQLARELDVSRQLITEILNFQRNISKTMVMKLSDRFKVNPSIFAENYELKPAKRVKEKA